MTRKQDLRSRVDRLIGPVTPHQVKLFVDKKLYRTVEVPQGVCSLRMKVGKMQPGFADMLFLVNLDGPGITERRCSCQADADTFIEMLRPGSPWLVMKTADNSIKTRKP